VPRIFAKIQKGVLMTREERASYMKVWRKKAHATPGYTRKVYEEQRDKVNKVRSDLKSGGCIVCGYNRCETALEFHHTNNDKERSPSAINTIKALLEEASKCVVVCAVCHRELHAGIIELTPSEINQRLIA